MSAKTNHLRLVERNPNANHEHADIESAVYNALVRAGDVDPRYIFVSAAGSDVTLVGWVPDSDEIARATEIAVRIKGVRKVYNELSQA